MADTVFSFRYRIEASPVKVDIPLPASPKKSSTAQNGNGGVEENASSLRGFQAVSIPTGPKSRVPQTRPEQNEAVELEEEKDPEVLLEERRRKRAEIMAKFQAQGRKENPIASTVASPAPETMGTGADSVNSGGTRTGQSR
jgi:hypothetical protein